MHTAFIQFVREYFQRPNGPVPLHEARTGEEELQQLKACLASGQLSSVGPLVHDFKNQIAEYTQIPYAVATSSGTAALHLALVSCGLQAGELVITTPFTFVATCHAIRYCGAEPLFVDIERNSLGLCPEALLSLLETATEPREDGCYHRASGRRIRLCLPVCAFGHPPVLDWLADICHEYQVGMIVDAAEALGSVYRDKPAAAWGKSSVLSFNGNKIITCGGGGMLLTHDAALADRARHLSQQARRQEGMYLTYDAVGYNYRMPALNAALGLGQFPRLPARVQALQQLAHAYRDFFHEYGLSVVQAPFATQSNYWQQAVVFDKPAAREAFLATTRQQAIDCRPAWTLMPELPVYRDCLSAELPSAQWAARHIALLPSLISHA